MTDSDAELVLTSDRLRLRLDPQRGAEILSMVSSNQGIELLGATPWQTRAADARRGRSALWQPCSEFAWLEGYRGGWQTLFPNAGPDKKVHGSHLGFHGEASIAPWVVKQCDASSAHLEIELFSLPLRLERRIEVRDDTLHLADRIVNLAEFAVQYDYVQHPAFGPPLVWPGSRIDSGARTFVAEQRASPIPAGRHRWPLVPDGSGGVLDLSVIADAPVSRYGWLTDFESRWYAIRNPALDLGVAVAWTGSQIDHAWLWQELHGDPDFPWFGRAYLMALEPASTAGSEAFGTQLRLPAHGVARFAMSVSVIGGRTPVEQLEEPREAPPGGSHDAEGP